MAKSSTKTAQKSGSVVAEQTQPVAVVENVAPVAVAPVKAAKKSRSSTASTEEKKLSNDIVQPTATTVAAPVSISSAESVVQSATTTADVETAIVDTSIAVKLNIFGAKLQQITSFLSNVKADYKNLEKSVNRELKIMSKNSRRKKSNVNRQPSGFVRPTLISDELAQFLGKSVGSEMARTEVSKEINAYIRSNNLQDKANGRKINADEKLSSLLKLGDEDILTYFNLQRFMKHHFIKTIPVDAAGVSESATL
jgi:chromatin remodeling complex protein RSC6